jgi:ubiquinone/menaquinone biosynthesis C-methylase UbiE
MSQSNYHPAAYLLGHARHELQRLIRQAQFFMPQTEHLFRLAGIEPGMHVLDVGSGMGDVAFAAASLVGPTGKVVGIENADEAIQAASARAQEYGLEHVTFIHADLNTYVPEQQFDALVGRFILIHQPDPVTSLRHLAQFVRPGGLIAFQETEFPDRLLSIPLVPLFEKCMRGCTKR